MSGVRKDGHGPQFDADFRPAERPDRHGAKFDRFTRSPTHTHGAKFDSGFGNKPGDEFERALARVPGDVRALPAGCP
jgi:hypothetical protein